MPAEGTGVPAHLLVPISYREAMMTLKKLMLGVALGALTLPIAMAQTPIAPSSGAAAPPAAQSSQVTGKASSQNTGKADFVMSQKPDQWLASTFKGTDVMGADNKKIGDVSDILFDKTGKIEAFVVNIGGFLGMGGKQVALAPSSFEVLRGANGKPDVLKLSINESEMKQAQNFTPYAPPRPTTTGMGGPTPGGMKPSTNTAPTGR